MRSDVMPTILPILMYHSVPLDDSSDELAVPSSLVDRQWHELVTEGWTLRGLTEAFQMVRSNPDAHVIGVTFDDAYGDFINALELLAKHDAKATLYVPTSFPGNADLSGTESRWLRWREVAALPKDIVEIGSHSHRHWPLDVLDKSEITREVQNSRRILMEQTGVSAVSFCYPHGYSNLRVREAVASAGYRNACIVGRRIADPWGDPYAIPRLQVTRAHNEAAITALAEYGELGMVPRLKRLAHPAWSTTRRIVYRATGRILT